MPRATTVAEIERELLDLYRDPQLTEKPPLLERRGGAFYSEAAIGLVASLHTGDGKIHEVDIRNNGTLAGLAPPTTSSRFPRRCRRKARSRCRSTRFDPTARPRPHVAAYERLAVEAATTGDAVVARKALLTHPLIAQTGLAAELLERLLAENRGYLPNFSAEAPA